MLSMQGTPPTNDRLESIAVKRRKGEVEGEGNFPAQRGKRTEQ